MKVLITGGRGQLGRELTTFFQKKDGFEVVPFGSKELDISDFDMTVKVFNTVKPDVVINCAAYTAVDDCESNPKKAFMVNSFGAKNVAIASRIVGAKLFHISTDYVFSGDKQIPYTEYDEPSPLSVYGKSKLWGEILVREHIKEHFILRVAGVYGRFGKNFVKTMIELSKKRDSIKVVCDQITTPTSTIEICNQIYAMIFSECYGIYHATCEGECSWFEFAKAIFEELGIEVNVIPCKTEEFPRPARRPRYSVLENFNLKLMRLNTLSFWRDALRRFLTSYCKEE